MKRLYISTNVCLINEQFTSCASAFNMFTRVPPAVRRLVVIE